MNSLHLDGRRTTPRYQIKDSFVETINATTPDGHGYKLRIVEISENSITCLTTGEIEDIIFEGTKIGGRFSDSDYEFNGIVASRRAVNKNIRLGIFLHDKANVISAFNKDILELAPNQRKINRRIKKAPEEGRREYDRRGLWSGLLSKSKRHFSHFIWELKNRKFYFYMKPLQSGTGAHVTVDGKEMIMMSSNNYLGLSTHPQVKEAAIEAIKKYGSSPAASSLLGGTLDIHLELEEALAKLKGTEAACIFSSGYVTNLTTLTTILDKADAVFNDDKNHASLIDGSHLSRAHFRAYRHKNIKDLTRKLSGNMSKYKLVATDTVFSMDGDIAPIPDIYRICKRHGAALMVDEAHATGIFGENGRGLLEHYNLEGKPEIIMGTLSKALAGTGGFVCGSKELINILKHTARAFVFSAYIPPSICAAVLTSLKIIQQDKERRLKLWNNTNHMRSGLRKLGFNVGESVSPIIPVIFETEMETNRMTQGLRENGIYASAALYPAVKKNATRVRITLMATHTEEDIETAIKAFKAIRDKTVN